MGPERLQKYYSRLRLEDADVVLHYGWGTGDCAEILRERAKPTASIIVFEPDEGLFRRSRSVRDRRFKFVVGSSVPRFFSDWGLGACGDTDNFLWIDAPGQGGNSDAAASLKLQFKTYLRDRAANLLTHFRNGPLYFEHAMRNIVYQSDSDVGRLFGSFRNTPLVLVSAGPSLDSNVHQLRGMGDRCFILSVDTALRPLLSAGVTPHAVIIADPSQENARHVAGAIPPATCLIAEQAVHPSVLEGVTKRFLFGLGMFPDSLFEKFGFGKSRLEAWGSVATTALDLACRMEASPVIFVGQDFAYSWNREYASHTIYHGAYFDVLEKGKARTRDIYGELAYTTENLIAYRDYFVRRMRESSKIRFINATEGGILTEGAEILPLRDALGAHLASSGHARDTLDSRHRPSELSNEALPHLMNVLKSGRDDCDCLGAFLELTAKEHLLRNNDVEIEKKIEWGAQFLDSIILASGFSAEGMKSHP